MRRRGVRREGVVAAHERKEACRATTNGEVKRRPLSTARWKR
jgi:hypothetical protein